MAIRIVIADDQPGLRSLLKLVLQSKKRFVVVGEAEDGKMALEEIRKSTPDALLLDLSMPIMDGFEVLAELKKRGPGLAVIVLSGYSASMAESEVLKLGAIKYLEKGLSPVEMEEQIFAAIEDARAAKK